MCPRLFQLVPSRPTTSLQIAVASFLPLIYAAIGIPLNLPALLFGLLDVCIKRECHKH